MKTPQVTPEWKTGIYIGNGTIATPQPKSFAPMFEFASGEVYGNAQRFATREEAENSARARFMVWTMPTGYHVEPSDDAPSYRWDDSAGDVRL